MLEGHLLGERYQIEKTIGGGGMADVYLAKDTILNRRVAIKVLRMEYADDEEFIARFDREAQSATSLSHQNIVNIYDVGEDEHILYMVMEYVDGMTLKEYIQKYGPVDIPEALDIMKQITSAIAHAHANHIVHRDIKPQNILLNTYGQIKVTDFGIAVALSATALTQTHSILGSVHYLSPEQARGGMATMKSDIYSLGIVLFELLTGRLPFSGQSPVSIALKHLQSETPSVRRFSPKVPQSVENIVLKAMAKDPFHRYETVYEMQDALASALDADKLNAPRYIPPKGVGEETKAIPIITDKEFQGETNQDTIVHQANTEVRENKQTSKKKKVKGKNTKAKKKKKRKKWPWILTILLVLVIASVAALFLVPKLLRPNDVEVPDVAGLTYNKAVSTLQESKLKVKKEMMYDETIKKGTVVKTDPRGGKAIKEHTTVTVFVSQGKEKIVFDDFVGQDYNQVKRILEKTGYDDVIKYDKPSNQPEGQIINQIQPASGDKVVPSDVKVIFEVSGGPEKITLTDLKGKTKKEAQQYLDNNHLAINIIEAHSDDVDKGQVFKQDPASGTSVVENSKVDVYISTGPKEKPPLTIDKTFTVPYQPKASDVMKKQKKPSETEGNDKAENQNNDKPENQGNAPDDQEDQNNKDDNNQDKTRTDHEKPIEQRVRIYIRDMNHDSLSNVAKEQNITKDTEFTITLTIAPNKSAEYMVMRDDDIIIDKTVDYKEGE